MSNSEVIVLVVSALNDRQLLEVSLKKEGYSVEAFGQILEAGKFIQNNHTTLLILDPRMADIEIKSFVAHMRSIPAKQNLPILAVLSEDEIDAKVDFLKIGVEDFITRPLMTREVLIKVHSLLERAKFKERLSQSSGLEGELSEHPALDTFKKAQRQNLTGCVAFSSSNHKAQVFFKNGEIIHAVSDHTQGERVVFKVMTWETGLYQIQLDSDTAVPQTIHSNTETLLYEGIQRIGKWQQLLQSIPPIESIVHINAKKLALHIAELPSATNAIVRLVDGKTSLKSILSQLGGDEIKALQTLCDLVQKQIIEVKENKNESIKFSASASIHEALRRHSNFPGPLEKISENTVHQKGASESLDSISAEKAVSDIPATRPISIEPISTKPASTQFKGNSREQFQTPPYNFQTHSLPSYPAVEPSEDVKSTVQKPKDTHKNNTEESTQELSNTIAPIANESKPPQINEVEANPISEKVAIHDEPAQNVAPQEQPQLTPELSEPSSKTDDKASTIKYESNHNGRKEDSISSEWMNTGAKEDEMHHSWDDLEPVDLPTGSKKAKRVTLITAGVSIVLIGGYFAYNKLFLPQPVELGVHDIAPMEPSQPKDSGPDEADQKSKAPQDGQKMDESPEDSEQQKSVEKTQDEMQQGEKVSVEEIDAKEEDAEAEKYAQFLEEAKAFEKKRKTKNAEKLYQQAIEANPSGSEALTNLGFLLLNRGKNKEAAELAERATGLDPTNSKAWITLGAARQALRDRKGANEAYKQCVQLGVGSFVSDCRLML